MGSALGFSSFEFSFFFVGSSFGGKVRVFVRVAYGGVGWVGFCFGGFFLRSFRAVRVVVSFWGS